MTRQNDQDTAERSPRPPAPPAAEAVTGAADAGANPDRPPAIDVPGTDPSMVVTAVPTDTGGRKEYTFAVDLADGREELKTVRGKSPGEKRVLKAAEIAVSLYEERCSPIGGWNKAEVLKKVLAAAKKASEAADAAARRTARDDATAPADGTAAATAPAEDAAVPDESVAEATGGRNPASPRAGSTFEPRVQITSGPRQGHDKRIVVAQALPDGGKPVELHRDKFDTDNHAAAQKFATLAVKAFVNLYGGIAEEAAAIAELVKTVREEADVAEEEDVARDAAGKTGPPKRSADGLLALIEDTIEPFHTPAGDAYVRARRTLPGGTRGPAECLKVGSREFFRHVNHEYYRKTGGTAPKEARQDAADTVEALAHFEGEERDVHRRTAWCEIDGHPAVVLDVGDKARRVIVVTKDGFEYRDESPVDFIRSKGMLALAEAAGRSNVERFVDALYLTGPSRVLVPAWLVAAAYPTGPYPILYLYGDYGGAKSTRAKACLDVIDPARKTLRRPPKSEQDLHVAFANSHVVAYDNLGKLKDWQSDAFCVAAYGGYGGGRALYTDSEEVLFYFQNPLITTGKGAYGKQPDFIDRTLPIEAAAIPPGAMKTDAAVAEEVRAAIPGMLTAVLNGISLGLKALAEGTPPPPNLPRMADYATRATFAESALGLPRGAVLKAHREAVGDVDESVLEGHPAVLKLAERFEREVADRDRENARRVADGEPALPPVEWEANATDLFAKVNFKSNREDNRENWPGNQKVFSQHLSDCKQILAARGIEVSRPRRKKQRLIVVRTVRRDRGGDGAAG